MKILFILTSYSFAQEYDEYMKKIGESSITSFVMNTDNNGNLYYVYVNERFYLDLIKYDIASDSTYVVSKDFIDDRPNNSGNVRNAGYG